MDDLARLTTRMAAYGGPPVRVCGRVVAARGAERVVRGLSRLAALGDQVSIRHGDGPALGEIVRIDRSTATAALYERRASAFVGADATLMGRMAVRPCDGWLGRVVDALGRPIDGKGALAKGPLRAVDADAPAALARRPLKKMVRTGVKVIDLFAPLVEGQRVGVFAGSGVGKSTLLGMIAAAQSFDVVVVALAGERGREVRELLEGPLAPHRERTVSVVATSDETPLMKRLAPMTAMTLAEHFRDSGRRVLLLVDSLTRAAHAARDVALSAGEAPVARGFPPSVFADMARLVERAGSCVRGGSITALLAVLVDGDDLDEPVADTARGLLDGHIVLSRSIAEAGRYPAVDPLASLSRLAMEAFREDEWELSRRLRALIARYEDSRDLRMLSGHKPGIDPDLDKAVELVPAIYEALVQKPSDAASTDAFSELAAVLTARQSAGAAAGKSA